MDAEKTKSMEKRFPNTRSALISLMSSLYCRKCFQKSRELFTLGNCEHHFCRTCAELNIGEPCLVCGMPSKASQTHEDKQLSVISSLCDDMLSLIDGKEPYFMKLGNEETPHKEDSFCKIKHKGKPTNLSEPSTSSVIVSKRDRNNSENFPETNEPELKRRKTTAKKVEKNIKNRPTVALKESNTPVKSPRFPKKKNVLMKRNAKGETPLQVATIKGKADLVKQLLEEGASPNVKDNAGWTPLHEAVNAGNVVIAELLINHSAFVNAPGLDNDTPLHDAVGNHRFECVKFLLSKGADPNSRNIHGQTPVDMALTDDMKEILRSAENVKAENSELAIKENPEEEMCFIGSALSNKDRASLHKCASMLGARVVEDFNSEVTHLISGTNEDGLCPRTLKYLFAVTSGKFVVNVDWINCCLEKNEKVSEEDFEIPGCTSMSHVKAAYNSRQNRLKQLPGLFDGCQFFLQGKFNPPNPTKEELSSLIKLGGGVILTREPRLHCLDDYKYTVPYHASTSSSLADCSIYILYDENQANPPAVNAQRMSTLPCSWFMDSISSFSLLEKSSYLS